MSSATIQYALSAFAGMSGFYRTIGATLFVTLLLGLMFGSRQRYLLPAWAPVELVLTGFIVSEGGFSLRV